MEDVPCPICGKSTDNVIWAKSGNTSKQCTCEVVYVSPRPTAEEMLQFYRDDNVDISAEVHIGDELYKRLHAKLSLQVIQKHIQRGTLVEIGAGAGFFADEARRAGFDVIVVEPNVELHNHLANHLGLTVYTDAADLAAAELSQIIDVVYFCDVLSHFADPVQELQGFRHLLKPNGLMIFETGNLGAMPKKWFAYIGDIGYPEHLYFFSPKSIEQLAGMAGLTVKENVLYNIVPYLAYKKRIEPLRNQLMYFSIRNRGKPASVVQVPQEEDSHHGNGLQQTANITTNTSANHHEESAATTTKPIPLVAKLRKYVTQDLYIHLLFYTRYRLGRYARFFKGPMTVIHITQRLES